MPVRGMSGQHQGTVRAGVASDLAINAVQVRVSEIFWVGDGMDLRGQAGADGFHRVAVGVGHLHSGGVIADAHGGVFHFRRVKQADVFQHIAPANFPLIGEGLGTAGDPRRPDHGLAGHGALLVAGHAGNIQPQGNGDFVGCAIIVGIGALCRDGGDIFAAIEGVLRNIGKGRGKNDFRNRTVGKCFRADLQHALRQHHPARGSGPKERLRFDLGQVSGQYQGFRLRAKA